MPNSAQPSSQLSPDRNWVAHAIEIIEADFNRSSDTHLLRVPLPASPGIALYMKDESTHPTGRLKPRLARSRASLREERGAREPQFGASGSAQYGRQRSCTNLDC